MTLYGSGWNCSPFWGTVLDIYKTLSCKSFIQKKKKIPTYLPTSKMMGRSTANIQFFKDGLVYRSGMILAILVGSHLGNIPMKFESHWPKGSGGVSFKGKLFTIFYF